MKKTIIKIFDKIIVLLLVLFGVFSSCDKPVEPEHGGIVLMYGPPTNVIINDDNSNSAQDILEISENNIQAESGL